MDKILEWVNLIYVIIGIIITVIPFAIALAKSIKRAVKDKTIGTIIINSIEEAEIHGTAGEDKLNYALDVIKNACEQLKVPFNKEEMQKQIETLIKFSKKVNTKITNK